MSEATRHPTPDEGGAERVGRYALISPCRNEAAFMRRTLESVIAQTVRPAIWVVVDDGSSDQTPQILEEYRQRHDWIRVIQREDRGARRVGAGVIEAFNQGFETLDLDQLDYVCKFDMDLIVPPGYFAGLIAKMEADPRLGTCSGKPFYHHPKTGVPTSEYCGSEMSVGMTKFYRIACLLDIGGFAPEAGWDGIDCHVCRMRGWWAEAYEDPELAFEHLRPMGSSQVSLWHGRVRNGRSLWYLGTHPVYMLAIAAFRLPKRPVIVGTAGMLWGYGRAFLSGAPRFGDRAYRKFVHRYQLRAMFIGKMAAAREAYERGRQAMAGDPAGSGPETGGG